MKLTETKQNQKLLDISLDDMHLESRNWLNEINFWRDEAAFFYSLIIKKTIKFVPIIAKTKLEKLEKDLIDITIDELNNLETSVKQHEKFLFNLLKSTSSDEENYRKKHHKLQLTFKTFENKFRNLKSEVFEMVKLITKETH